MPEGPGAAPLKVVADGAVDEADLAAATARPAAGRRRGLERLRRLATIDGGGVLEAEGLGGHGGDLGGVTPYRGGRR